MEYVAVGKVIYDIVNYIMNKQKAAQDASNLANEFTANAQEIINATKSAINLAFAEAKINDGRDRIKDAQGQLGLINAGPAEFTKAYDYCDQAINRLSDIDVAVPAQPFYVAAVSTRITALELAGKIGDAQNTAEAANVYLRSMKEPTELAVRARFLFTLELAVAYYTLDGVVQQVNSTDQNVVKAQMEAHISSEFQLVNAPFSRSACVLHLHKAGYSKVENVALRGANGFYLSLGPQNQVWATAGAVSDYTVQMELFRNGNFVAFIHTNGLFMTYGSPEFIGSVVEYLNPISVFEMTALLGNKYAFKSPQSHRYLNVQHKDDPDRWVLECQDVAPSTYSEFDMIPI